VKKEQLDSEALNEIGLKERIIRYCFLNQRKILQYGLGAIGLCILAILYGNIGFGGSGAGSTHQAKVAFEQWKQTPGDGLLAKEMERALEKAPGLKRALEAEIAQVFLSDGQFHNADVMATNCIERLNLESPLHAEFAQASLLIEQKEYQKALELSVSLKEHLEGDEERSSLCGWNLLRLAFLQKQLHNKSGELAAWEDVKEFMQKGGNSAGKFFEIGIGRPDFSLADFISHREREISE
jgi:hypothetical protein